jgi:hypothetical protein
MPRPHQAAPAPGCHSPSGGALVAAARDGDRGHGASPSSVGMNLRAPDAYASTIRAHEDEGDDMALRKFGFIVTGAQLEPGRNRVVMSSPAFEMIAVGVATAA